MNSPNDLYHKARFYLTWKIKFTKDKIARLVFKPKVTWESELDKAFRDDDTEIMRKDNERYR